MPRMRDCRYVFGNQYRRPERYQPEDTRPLNYAEKEALFLMQQMVNYLQADQMQLAQTVLAYWKALPEERQGDEELKNLFYKFEGHMSPGGIYDKQIRENRLAAWNEKQEENLRRAGIRKATYRDINSKGKVKKPFIRAQVAAMAAKGWTREQMLEHFPAGSCTSWDIGRAMKHFNDAAGDRAAALRQRIDMRVSAINNAMDKHGVTNVMERARIMATYLQEMQEKDERGGYDDDETELDELEAAKPFRSE